MKSVLVALALLCACGRGKETGHPVNDSDSSIQDTCDSNDTSGPDTGSTLERACADLPWIDVAMGAFAGCGIHTDGCIECWGNKGGHDEDYGGLEANYEFPMGTSGFIQVDVGDEDTMGEGFGNVCGLKGDGSVQCWGMRPDPDETPVPDGVYTWIAVGDWGACAILSDGTLNCWGSYSLPPEGKVDQVGMCYDRVCVRYTDRTVACSSLSPEPGETFSAITQSGYCGVLDDGTVDCWFGYTHDAPFPTQPAVAVSTGDSYACAILDGGEIYCWGRDADYRCDLTAYLLDAPAGAYDHIACGSYSCCAVSWDGVVSCWGEGNQGQTEPPGTYTL